VYPSTLYLIFKKNCYINKIQRISWTGKYYPW